MATPTRHLPSSYLSQRLLNILDVLVRENGLQSWQTSLWWDRLECQSSSGLARQEMVDIYLWAGSSLRSVILRNPPGNLRWMTRGLQKGELPGVSHSRMLLRIAKTFRANTSRNQEVQTQISPLPTQACSPVLPLQESTMTELIGTIQYAVFITWQLDCVLHLFQLVQFTSW